MFGRRLGWLGPLFAASMLGIVLACGGDAAISVTEVPPTPLEPGVTTAPVTAAAAIKTPIPPPLSAALKLKVTSPSGDVVVTTPAVTVAGLTSPDATVSVNGILTVPNSLGRFSLELPLSIGENPLPVEVIATSIAGEELSVVRSVLLVPTVSGVFQQPELQGFFGVITEVSSSQDAAGGMTKITVEISSGEAGSGQSGFGEVGD